MIDKTYHPFSGSKRDDLGGLAEESSTSKEELKQRIEILQTRLTLLESKNERLKRSGEEADCFGGSPEKKRVESNLMYREEVLQSVFNESTDALFLTTSPERRIVQCNRIAVEVFEVASEEWMSGRVAYTLHQVLHPDEIGRMRQQLLKTGYWSAEILCLTTRGRTFLENIMVKSMYVSGTAYELVRVKVVKEKPVERVNVYKAGLEAVLESTQDVIFSLNTHFCYTSFNTNHRRLMRNNYGIEIALEKKAFNREKDFYKDYKCIVNDLLRAMKGEQLTVIHAFGPTEVYYELYLNPIRNEAGVVTGVAVFAKDISERKKGEERLITSLREKEVLLSEVYPRVKNNLNVVISLLTLQANRTHDPSVLDALNESKNRIYAMALVHEHLYRSGDMSSINTREYIISLARNVREVYLKRCSRIAVQIEVELGIHFPLDISIPLGLILNELLTNSFQHAYDPGQVGRVGVKLANVEKHRYLLGVWDEGRDFDPGVMAQADSKSLGLKIVEMLVNQINGTLHFGSVARPEGSDPATSETAQRNCVEIQFNYPRY